MTPPILLDTNFVSALFDLRRPNHTAAVGPAQVFSAADLVLLPVIVLAELRYGMEAAQRRRVGCEAISCQMLIQAGLYPLAEVGQHTAGAYAS